MSERKRERGAMRRTSVALRTVLVVDAAVFLVAAALNAGVHIPLAFATLRFAAPVWQAGIGEAVIGVVLLVAAVLGKRGVAWTAFAMSVLGIAFGLSSDRVVGAARDVHVVLVPLAVIVLALLLWRRRRAT